MGEKTAGETPDPHILSNWSCIKFAAALPLKQQILRASDLRQVSGPASAVALLKGQMNLFSTTNCLLLWEARGFSIAKNSKVSQPEGRQAKWVNHRTDYEGPAARQYFSGNRESPLMASDWTKRGPGEPRRFFGDFLCVQKVTRVWAGEARKPQPEAACFGRILCRSAEYP